MFFSASKIFWFFANPGNLLLMALGLGTLLLWTRWPRLGRGLILAAVMSGLFFAVVPVGLWSLTVLEDRFPPPLELPESVDGIIVLGGVLSPKLTVERGQTVIGGAVERLFEFAKLAKKYPQAKLVFSAGSGTISNQELKEAHFVGPVFRQLGLDPGRILFEDQSRNTAENASLSKRLADPKEGETWILVTSAFHMPRAVGCFRKVGWDVLPYPVDYSTSGKVSFRFDFLAGWGQLSAGLHEWLGLLIYWISDRTDELYPAPVG